MQEKKTRFSPEQERAITTRDRTLLVSAAAGSGKTTTLTERIIRSLLDKESPESIQNMLIVTFTNASVYDLKEKISKALISAVNENPENKRLERELRALDYARIMTIDSFCAEVVRTHAERLGITPAYRISDSAEILLLERSVINSLIDAAFEGELAPEITPNAFEALCDALTGVKNTASLCDVLLSLYEKTKSSIAGVKIFGEFSKSYAAFSKEAPENTEYGKYLMNMAAEELMHLAALADHYTRPLMESGDASEIKLANQLNEAKDRLTRIAKTARGSTYENLRNEIFTFSFPPAPTIKGEKPYEVVKAINYRNDIKKAFATLKERLFSYETAEWQGLYSDLSESVDTLAKFLEKFASTYYEEKRRRGTLEFADIERLAYNALWQDGKVTDVAKGYQEIFTSVYIDEYQDVNELQNKIFEAVSPKKSRFMVGDIKQSIYGFRSARPEIFAEMKRSFPPLDDGKSDESSIFMSNNYRCDKGIVDFVNEVFLKLFGVTADSIGYVKEDELKCMKSYEGFIPEYERAHIVLIERDKNESDGTESADSEQGEAAEKPIEDSEPDAPIFVAKRIRELIECGKRRDGKPITPKDIAIITRTRKRFKDYRHALLNEGISSVMTEDRDFFLNKEILLTLSFLNAIDNPRRDIHLAALMCSPLYSFTADEMYLIKSAAPRATLYEAATRYYECNPEFTKLGNFIDTLRHYRTVAEGMSIDNLLIRLYRESGLLALASRTGGKENLQRLLSYARSFEGSAYKGLYSFIAFVNSIIEKGQTINKSENGATDEDAVHIGTIHSAKGLEFPVVFLCDASNSIVNLDNKEKIAFCEDFGISFLLRAPHGHALVENPMQRIIRDYGDKKFFEEICRLLYVALTRPKEKLYVVGICKNEPDEYLEKMKFCGETLSPYSLRRLKSYMDMILASTQNAEIEIIPKSEAVYSENEKPEQSSEQKINTGAHDPQIEYELSDRFSYVYPNAHLCILPEKLSVSRLSPTVLDGSEGDTLTDFDTLAENAERREYVPAFISGKPADESAKRGIATHNFMQFFDIESIKKNGVTAELERLASRGFLSNKTASLVRTDELFKFRKSELFEAMSNAKALHREFRFNTHLPAELFTENDDKTQSYKGQTVLVQGVIDCIIENEDGTLRLIDYKTDRLTKQELENEELARKKLYEKHSLQLYYYSLAVEKIFGKKPTRVEVYSLPLGKTVDVKIISGISRRKI